MSKKQLRSRIDQLFANLGGGDPLPPEQGQPEQGRAVPDYPEPNVPVLQAPNAPLIGWSWEIDAHFCYTQCGPEVSDALRMNPRSFLGQSILSFGLEQTCRASLETALQREEGSAELDVLFNTMLGTAVPVRLHLLARLQQDGRPAGWRGYAQRIPHLTQVPPTLTKGNNGNKTPVNLSRVLSDTKPANPVEGIEPPEKSSEITRPAASRKQRSGFALQEGSITPAGQIWTDTGRQSLLKHQLVQEDSTPERPAALAVPLQMRGIGDLLLEIVDDSGEREWSEDDRFLVMEISAQLALALDNAQLYRSVQHELADRVRAEQGILRRNRDLATLNKIGQQLSRLASRNEIFELLAAMIGEVLDNRNLYICTFTSQKDLLSFPVFRQDNLPVDQPDRPFANGIPEYVIDNRTSLLINENTAAMLSQMGVEVAERVPASLMALPMIAGERSIGAIVVQNYERENAYDEVHLELLSTAAAQATTALENADLFQQMQKALKTLETRERYQANVARAAAALTQQGTQSMSEVLKALGQAAQCSRVYYARLVKENAEPYWSVAADWVDPATAYRFDKTRLQHLLLSAYPNWASSLLERGWAVTRPAGEDNPEANFLSQQRIHSTLLLAVQSGSTTPGFLAFDQLDTDRVWQNEEINALRVAADAISNTFIREGLLEQVRVTLDETEELYKASNRLALASDMQDMVAAVLSGVRSPDINRAVLLLFDYDTIGKIEQITVRANWYNGRGTPPPPVGTDFGRVNQDRFLLTSSPVFLDELQEAQFSPELFAYLQENNVRSLALLPLWSGKQQIGALLLLSEAIHHFHGRETRTYPPLADQMAIAVENQRLFEQTQIALSETELLYQVNNRIAQASAAQDMMALIVEAVLPAGATRACLFMIESDAEGELMHLEYVGAQPAKGPYQPIGMQMPVSALPIIKSLTDEPLVISDISQAGLDPASLRTLTQNGIGAACFVPLRTSGRLMGMICASSGDPVNFTAEDTRLLRVVGNSIAVALDKQRLLRQAQRRALELQTASEIARDTASTLSLDLLLERIVNMLLQRFSFYHASIYLLDEARIHAVIREATGEAGKEMKKRGHKVVVGSRSVIGMVTTTGEPLILNDAQHNPIHQFNPLLPETRSEMGVPLKLGPTIIGALNLKSREISAFNQDDVTVLQILADQIAIAIENARAYELSQKAIADMQEIDRVKSQFLANMSHELRTPLNSIIGFSRVILKGIDGPINDTQKQDLSAIYTSGQHLLNLINDILDLSKIEAGKMELSFSDLNLSDLVNSAMSTAVGLVKDKPIKLHTVIPDNLPAVRADNTRVRQVLINFLSNAAKFTDEGTITVEVSQATSPENKPEVMIAVTDTGPGIAPTDQAKLFLPFSQVDDSPTRKTGGTGLGLSICRSLIEMHGGRIGLLRSVVNQGSTFFFTLPLSLPEPALSTDVLAPASNIVLAIDDDERVIHLYERYLKPHGYQVVPLTDPKQALARIEEIKPFAITLDIMMPEKDGWQVLHELKNHPTARDIPVIICSILENQEQGFSMGAADYLVKPFLQEDIINAINRLNRDGQIRNVLVIDDDAGDLRLVQKMLESNAGFHLSTAQGGQLGLEAIRSERPDIIILDLFMPDINGFEILNQLRAAPELRHIPVIILTGADLTPEQLQQLNQFGQGVLSKGYLGEKDLMNTLEEALRKFQPVAAGD